MFGDQNVSVGHLDIWGQDGQTTSTFQHAPAWLEIPQAIAISPELPLQLGVQMLGTAPSGEPLLFSTLTDTTPGTWAPHVIQRLHALHKNSIPSVAPLDEIHYLGAVLQAMRMFCADFQREAKALWRRLLFQVMITHVDDHLRSMGFLYIHGKNRTDASAMLDASSGLQTGSQVAWCDRGFIPFALGNRAHQGAKTGPGIGSA